MGRIRTFTEADIPLVADLHRRVFNTGDRLSEQLLNAYRTYFTEVYLRNPWFDDRIQSLLSEEDGGEISGFLGVVPRPMRVKGKPATAAVATNFIVDPKGRSGPGGGLKLLRTFFQGPQDFSIADEANETSRVVWEGLGGTTSLLHSIHWTRPLRPMQLGLSFVSKRRSMAPVAAIARPVAKICDALAVRVPQTPFHLSPPDLSGEEADLSTLMECFNDLAPKRMVQPNYDIKTLEWTVHLATRRRLLGQFQKVAVRNKRSEIVGLYLYYRNPGGLGEVLHMSAKKRHADQVFDHLSYHAWRQGVIALIGRLEPDFIRTVSDAYCLLQRGRPWMLIHSPDSEILNALQRGDALLSRLEGEFCLRFR